VLYDDEEEDAFSPTENCSFVVGSFSLSHDDVVDVVVDVVVADDDDDTGEEEEDAVKNEKR
jgi:hypothetical protein